MEPFMELSRREDAARQPVSCREIAWSELVDPGTNGFMPGMHIRVRRRLGYFHHGIYVGDDEVIQFGGRIMDKPTATVGAVSLVAFESGGRAEAVEHDREHALMRTLILPTPPWLPAAEAPEKIICRARWLAANHPPGRYHLVGYNCEHAANFCATGWYTESHQVRAFFGLNALLALPLAYRFGRRAKSPPTRAWYILAAAKTVLSLTTITLYNWNIRRFWVDIGRQWRIYEQSLDA
jgi:Lecithin retinol acyltransferase